MQAWFAPYNFSRSVGECINCMYQLVLVRYRKSAEVMSLMLSFMRAFMRAFILESSNRPLPLGRHFKISRWISFTDRLGTFQTPALY